MIFIPSRHFPFLQYGVYFLGGPLLDPEHRPGLGVIAQKQLLRGTQKRSREDFLKATERLGTELSPLSYRYAFGMSGGVLSRSIKEVAALVEEALIYPALDEQEIEQSKRSYCADLESNLDNDSALAWLWLHRSVLSDHEQWKCVSSHSDQIMEISKSDIEAHWHRIHQKSAFFPCASGCADEDELLGIFDHLRQQLPDDHQVTLAKKNIQIPNQRLLTIIDKPNRKQAQLLIAQPLPPPGHEDELAIAVAIVAFGGTFSSPLMQEIRVKRGLSYGAQASTKEDWGTRLLVMNAVPDIKDAHQTLSLMLKLWEEAKDGDLLSDQTIQFAKDFLINAHPFSLETAAIRAVRELRSTMQGLDPKRIFEIPKLIRALSPEVIREKAKMYFNPRSCHILALGDGKKLSKALKVGLEIDAWRMIDFNAKPVLAKSTGFIGG